MSLQPLATILVKKSDGTTARMTLDEIKKMKAPAPQPAAVAVSASIPDVKAIKPSPVVNQRMVVAPLPRASDDLPPARSAAPVDFSSLLEEELPAVSSTLARASAPRDEQIEAVIKRLRFTITPELMPRLRTVLQLYLKDVRGVDPTRSMLERSASDGGVGLNAAQVGEVLLSCQNMLPAVISRANVPATATPFNAFKHPAVASKKDEMGRSTPRPQQKNFAPTIPFKLNSQATHRVPMQEIQAPSHGTMGPVDEIAAFTLTDFRRLAATTEEAALRLKQKSINLQEESVLLYLDALEAWRQSPLYKNYVACVTEHLAHGQPLTAPVLSKEVIQTKEIVALVGMEQALRMI